MIEMSFQRCRSYEVPARTPLPATAANPAWQDLLEELYREVYLPKREICITNRNKELSDIKGLVGNAWGRLSGPALWAQLEESLDSGSVSIWRVFRKGTPEQQYSDEVVARQPYSLETWARKARPGITIKIKFADMRVEDIVRGTCGR